MMTEHAFGIFDHLERGELALDALYESRLKLLEHADAAGFHAYHLAEHHATPLGSAPSPGIFLASIAQRTQRLRFGPLVYLLPLYEPLRLIEEICMLDQLSGGRLQVGVGRGISPFELAYFGVEFLRSREMFEEALEVLSLGLHGERLSFRGRYYDYLDVPIVLRPAQQPNPPFWYAATSPEGVRFAAQRGMHVASAGPARVLRPLSEQYRHARLQADRDGRADGDTPLALGGADATPFFGAVRHIYVAESEQQAREVAGPAYSVFYDNIALLWRQFRALPVQFTPDLDVAMRNEAAIVGTPSQVRDAVGHFFRESGCNYLIGAFAWGNLSPDQARASLDLFASKVMHESY